MVGWGRVVIGRVRDRRRRIREEEERDKFFGRYRGG